MKSGGGDGVFERDIQGKGCACGQDGGDSLGLSGWESIQRLDMLPEDIAGQMADSAARNALIVNTYEK